MDTARLTYIAIRPTFELGDYTVSACVDDARAYQIEFGETGRPSYTVAVYDRVADAIDDALALAREYNHLRLWYDGQEIQAEFSDWRSFALMFADLDDAWTIVEDVAAGRRKSHEREVVYAMKAGTLIGTALARVIV